MMTENQESQPDDREKPEATAEAPETAAEALPPAPAWEADLDEYPVRPPEQDPRWALWVFWIWVSFTLASIVFMVVLLVLGYVWD